MVTMCSYDIADDKRRAKVADILLSHGCLRLHYSVYAGEINGPTYRSLVKALRSEIGQGKIESVRVWRLSVDAFRNNIHLGDGQDIELIFMNRGMTVIF